MKKSLLVSIVLLLSVFFVQAQTTQKLAHVNTAEILQALPEVKAADAKLQKLQGEFESILKTMTVEYQTKVTNFRNNQSTMSDVMRDASISEIQDIEKRISDFQQKAQNDLQKKQMELYEPIKEKATKAIDAVAKENGYAYVFDVSQHVSVVYYDGGTDITDAVKKKLGL